MNIKEIQKSKINSIDFDKLAFGQTFTDHMLICHYREGKWQTPEISPYKPLTLEPSSSIFHYGQGTDWHVVKAQIHARKTMSIPT